METAASSFSSSPPSSAPSSSSPDRRYPVILSYSSLDVPISFLNQFWKEIRRQGFEPFTDNEIERCESIGPHLKKAIRGSRIVVVILSENYASSSQCLNELVKIIKYRKKVGQIVMTVFYEVEPTDVKKQTGVFGENFRKTCKGRTTEEIERWVQALREVATIAGYVSSNWEDEVAMIKIIATDVSKILNNSPPSSDVEGLAGMDAHIEKLEQMLCLDLEEVRMIGIWGPPGIGKTTIARALFAKYRCQFHFSVFMKYNKELEKNWSNDYYAEMQLKNQFLSQLLNRSKNDEILHSGVAQARLKHKKVLVVFDDVDSLEKLGALASKTHWFGPGSRSIIITRDKILLKALGFEHMYEVEVPPPDVALQFCRENEEAMIGRLATDVSNILNHSTQRMSCLDSEKEKFHTSDRAFKGIFNRVQYYINIYCADTLQYSFASHLAMDFGRKGINAFVNRSETLDVIERASASVVVFSKNYFSSTSCLDNLVRVLQCRMKTGQLVVSVFYDTGPLDAVVQEHESTDRIREWSSAIQELRELPGYQFREECSECELVKVIVKDVYEKLFPMEQIGINSRLLEMEQLLCKQPWGIRRIGIWGMPGIGKTTLAKAFFNQIAEGYDASCFIKHFDKVFHEKGRHHLLDEHFGKVLKELPRACSSITRPSLPRDKLSKKRTLVVLDDVHNPLVAESFLKGFHWFGPGSIIIITSRDKQVFRLCQINHIYEVQSLNGYEALQLFRENVREQNLPELSTEVIDYANGNPLALEFYGRELKGKKLSEMHTTFLKLKLRTPYKIYDMFKSSYESLNDNEKNIFLDIACFLKGENVDYVLQLLEGCGFFPHVGIDVLVDKCLVTISENKLKMCSIIQDFGREIIIGETIQIERRRRLWEPYTIKFLLEDDELEVTGNLEGTYTRALGTEDIEGIFMDFSNLIFDVKPGAFECMFNLRFLKIYDSSYKHYGLCLPKGLKSLPYELRLLHWEGYPLQSLPQDFDPSQLVELNMPYSKLEKLWEGTKNLGLLKVVRICHSQQLTQIDDIFKAQNIEIIDLTGCIKLQSFPAIGQLQFLRVVKLSSCREIKSFQEVSPNIEELYLIGCSSLVELHSSIGNAAYLKKLDLSDCSRLVKLPSFGNATNLRKLNLCSSLVELPSSIGNAANLKELYLKNCSSLVELPSSIENATNLQVLDLRSCSSLVELPSSIGNVANLKELYLSDCSRLVELPSSIGNATNLTQLYLKDCSRLVKLPSSIGNATNLQVLDLGYCSRLVELPSSIGSAANLKRLYLSHCSSLVKLPSSIGNAANLHELDIEYCSSLVELPSSIGNITNLKKLCITGCSSLVGLPYSIGNFINLKELNLEYHPSFVEVPSIGNATKLAYLTGSLVELPSSFENPTNLKEIYPDHISNSASLMSINPDEENSLPFVTFSDSLGAKCIEVRGATSENLFLLKGEQKDDHSLYLILYIEDKDEILWTMNKSRKRNIHFLFYQESDTAIKVTCEIYMELGITEAKYVAELIDILLVNMIPNWETSVRVDHLIHPQLKQKSTSYPHEVKTLRQEKLLSRRGRNNRKKSKRMSNDTETEIPRCIVMLRNDPTGQRNVSKNMVLNHEHGKEEADS